jgi:hypothetical protein
MNITERIRLWLGWCPEHQAKKGTLEFSVKSQDEIASGDRSPGAISAIDLRSLKWMDVYHNRVLVLTGGLSALFLSQFLMVVSRFSGRLELFLMGFFIGSFVMLVGSYRVIRKLNREGKIEQLKTRKDYLFIGVAIFVSIYLGVWINFWVGAAYGKDAPIIAVTGFVLPMWFWLLSIIWWEKRNNKLLIVKRIGSIESVEKEEKK